MKSDAQQVIDALQVKIAEIRQQLGPERIEALHRRARERCPGADAVVAVGVGSDGITSPVPIIYCENIYQVIPKLGQYNVKAVIIGDRCDTGSVEAIANVICDRGIPVGRISADGRKVVGINGTAYEGSLRYWLRELHDDG